MHKVKTFRRQSTLGICVNVMDRVRGGWLNYSPQGPAAAWGGSPGNPRSRDSAELGIETQSASKAVSFPFCLILVMCIC